MMTRHIHDEWEGKQSTQAAKWRRWMASKGRLVFLAEQNLESIELDFGSLGFSGGEVRLMEEDADLARAAFCTDRVVFSLDDEVRALFAKASRQLEPLKKIMWANPHTDPSCLNWVARGAPSNSSRMLCNYSETR